MAEKLNLLTVFLSFFFFLYFFYPGLMIKVPVVENWATSAKCRCSGCGFYFYFLVKCWVSSSSFNAASDLNNSALLEEIKEESG